MKLFEIYQSILESAAVTDIQDSILNHKVVELEYDDGRIGTRTVEPYAYGEMRSGSKVVRAFQISGPTNTANNQWKIFRLDKIKSYRPTQRAFTRPRPLFNKMGDRTFAKVFLIAKFDDRTLLQKAGDFFKTGAEKVKKLFKSHHEKSLGAAQRVLVEDFLHSYNVDYDIENGEVKFGAKKDSYIKGK